MIIEIQSNSNPSLSYNVWANSERVNCPSSYIHPSNWEEEDIQKLLEPDQYSVFEDGAKYQFNIPNWKYNLLTGNKPVTNGKGQREQLLFLSQWD